MRFAWHEVDTPSSRTAQAAPPSQTRFSRGGGRERDSHSGSAANSISVVLFAPLYLAQSAARSRVRISRGERIESRFNVTKPNTDSMLLSVGAVMSRERVAMAVSLLFPDGGGQRAYRNR